MTAPAHFDLCVIGSGSGNTIVDRHFVDWKVAIVERGTFGGTCLNVGCIPTKMLVHPADIVETVRHAGRLGVDATIDAVRWPDIRDRVFGRIDPISASGRTYRDQGRNVTLFERHARFVGHKRLLLEGSDGEEDVEITADRFVLAVGARPYAPPIPGLDLVAYDTSDTIMRIDEIPGRLAVLGGGYIAAELGHVFEAFGADVTMLVRGDTLLSHEDADVAALVTRRLSERIDVVTGAAVDRVGMDGDEFVVEVSTPDGARTVRADRLLVATGRVPNGAQLDPDRTGVRLDADGYIVCDDTLSTGVDGIWALGDARSPEQLKHLANRDARVIQHNLLHPGQPRRVDERFVPHAVFTNPQVAAVGLTEAQAHARGRPFATATIDYGHTAYGWAMEDTTSIAKLIGDVGSRQVLGAHIVGPQASILVQQLTQGMQFGRSVDEMAREVIYPHPALSEVVENALIALGRALDRTGDDLSGAG